MSPDNVENQHAEPLIVTDYWTCESSIPDLGPARGNKKTENEHTAKEKTEEKDEQPKEAHSKRRWRLKKK